MTKPRTILFIGTCAQFEPEALRSAGFYVYDSSQTDFGLEEDISFYHSVFGSFPDFLFFAYLGHCSNRSLSTVKIISNKYCIPIMIGHSKKNEHVTDTEDAMFIRRAILDYEKPAGIRRKINDQYLLYFALEPRKKVA